MTDSTSRTFRVVDSRTGYVYGERTFHNDARDDVAIVAAWTAEMYSHARRMIANGDATVVSDAPRAVATDTGKMHGPSEEDAAAARAYYGYVVAVAQTLQDAAHGDLDVAFGTTPVPPALRAVKHDMGDPSPRERAAVKAAATCLSAGFTPAQARWAVPAMLAGSRD